MWTTWPIVQTLENWVGLEAVQKSRVVSHLYAEALGGGLEAAGGSAAFLLVY